MTNLEDLAARCEGASEGSRFIDKEIHRLIEGAPELGHPQDYGWREDEYGWWLATGEDQRIPQKRISPLHYTGNFDAAMSLAPDGVYLAFDPHFMDEDGVVRFAGYSFRPDWQRWEPSGKDWLNASERTELCATPVLAILAAALRSRAHASLTENGNG